MNLLHRNKTGWEYPVCFYDMDANLNTTGKRIKYLRETVNSWNGKTFREELKKRTGEELTAPKLTNHEQDTSMPGYSTLVNYAKVLGTTTDYLLMITDDPTPAKKTDRIVLMEAQGEEERRILEEISSLLEEMNVGDLRFVLDIVRRISAVVVPTPAQAVDGEIEPLIELVLAAIEKVGGTQMREKALIAMDNSLPSNSPFAAAWRQFRLKRPNKPLQCNN